MGRMSLKRTRVLNQFTTRHTMSESTRKKNAE
jgi:hypothetical protein